MTDPETLDARTPRREREFAEIAGDPREKSGQPETARPGMVVPSLVISAVRPDSPEALVLIDALDADLRDRYPEGTIHGLRPEDVRDPRVRFLVARIGDQSAGCIAVREIEPGVGEVKRMFVRPGHRGRGIARALLAELESQARAGGYSVLRLETGSRQPEAVGLYRSAGYHPVPPFGEYVGNPYSVCFEKRL